MYLTRFEIHSELRKYDDKKGLLRKVRGDRNCIIQLKRFCLTLDHNPLNTENLVRLVTILRRYYPHEANGLLSQKVYDNLKNKFGQVMNACDILERAGMLEDVSMGFILEQSDQALTFANLLVKLHENQHYNYSSQDEIFDNALQCIARFCSPQFFSYACSLIRENTKQQMLQESNNRGDTVLSIAAKRQGNNYLFTLLLRENNGTNDLVFRECLSHYSPQSLETACEIQYGAFPTLWHLCASLLNEESCFLFLEKCTAQVVDHFLILQDGDQISGFELAFQHLHKERIFENALKKASPDVLNQVIQMKNKRGINGLLTAWVYCKRRYIQLFHLLLKKCNSESLKPVLLEKNHVDGSVLNQILADGDIQSCQILCEKFGMVEWVRFLLLEEKRFIYPGFFYHQSIINSLMHVNTTKYYVMNLLFMGDLKVSDFTDEELKSIIKMLSPEKICIGTYLKSLPADQNIPIAWEDEESLSYKLIQELGLKEDIEQLKDKQAVNCLNRQLTYRLLGTLAFMHHRNLQKQRAFFNPLDKEPPLEITLFRRIYKLNKNRLDEEVSIEVVSTIKILMDDMERKGLIGQGEKGDELCNKIVRAMCSTSTMKNIYFGKQSSQEDIVIEGNPIEMLQDMFRTLKTFTDPRLSDEKQIQAIYLIQALINTINDRAKIEIFYREHYRDTIENPAADPLCYLLTRQDGFQMIPIHINNYASLEALRNGLDKIVSYCNGIYGRAKNSGQLLEFFAQMGNDGICLEKRTYSLWEWGYSMGLLSFTERVRQFVTDAESYCKALELPVGELKTTLDFIEAHLSNTHCEKDDKWAPRGILTIGNIKQYLLEVLCYDEKGRHQPPAKWSRA